MNTLRESVQDYLAMRHSLGFKLQKAGVELQDFAAFMEQRHASHITTSLALKWAQKPTLLPTDAGSTEWSATVSTASGTSVPLHQ